MRIYSSTRTPRSTAFAVLWVWLFSVAAGVANACLLETPASHSDAVSVVTVAHGHDHASGHAEGSQAHKQSCLKACDDGTKALPKAQAGVDQADPGPAPLVTTLWAVATAQPVLASRQLDELQVPLVGPPLRVRYSRLAL